ncbi:hypothetical protein CWB96_00380 [Pseudoalteromonas citrea]|uniref:Uncharacterized protein n=1 Tax=Pseudoalteromonas citrea TaxID=43655 RepID=A0A5S3XVC3_9GAMM|nr:hypothetical protein [Pseudoalteromonas citrea]TMP46323.1 hypothetical protein CWB97_02375 [Pseudoalteromonas citrea]TMP63099.1 hypothetical protein CWB96_00380 [Pseudoalteromonas citrea]
MDTQLTDGITHSLSDIGTKITSSHASLSQTCGNAAAQQKSMLSSSISHSIANMRSKMEIFSTTFSGLITQTRALNLAEDPPIYYFLSGIHRVFLGFSSSHYFAEMHSQADTLSTLNQCNDITNAYQAISNELSNHHLVLDEMITFIQQVDALLSGAMQEYASLSMDIGHSLSSPLPTFEQGYATAAIYNDDMKRKYEVIKELKNNLQDDAITLAMIAPWTARKIRESLKIAQTIEQYAEQMSTTTKHRLYEAIELLNTEYPHDTTHNEPQTNPHNDQLNLNFSEQSWRATRAEWQWESTNTVRISNDSYYDRGVIFYNNISFETWRGTLVVHLSSAAQHGYSAGLALGYLENGELLSVIKRSKSGLSTLEINPSTLITPSNFIPTTDHSSQHVFDNWADTLGIEMKLIFREADITVMAREINSQGEWDTLTVNPSALTSINIGLIALGADITFSMQARIDS